MANKKDNEPVIAPTETWLTRSEPDGMGQTTERHPSYGMIGVHRVNGETSLFQSDVKHYHFIRIEIKDARKVIHGTHEFIMGDTVVASVHMSEAQFAQMITQPNVGDGVPCTIHYSAGDSDQPWLNPRRGSRPEPPDPERFNIKYDEDTAYRVKIVTDNLKAIQDTLTALVDGTVKVNKGTLKKMLAEVDSARMQVEQNMSYIQQCAAEELEKKVGSAIMEFEAYMTRSCEVRGLLTMRAEAPVLALEAMATVDGADVPRLTAGTPECPSRAAGAD